MKFDISLLYSVVVGAQVVLSTPVRSRTPYNVKETHSAPSKWTKLGRAPPQHKLHLKIGLKQNNFEELSRHLNEGIAPFQFPSNTRGNGSSQFGQSLTQTTTAMVSIYP